MVVMVYQQGQGWRSALMSVGVSLALMSVNYVRPSVLLACVVVLVGVMVVFFGESWSRLWREFLRSLSAPLFDGRPAERSGNLDEVLTRLRSTPTEVYEPPSRLSIRDLKRRVRSTAIERPDLERAYTEQFDVCSICAEPWQDQDVYRRLQKCGHLYHIECIDRWALSSADKGKVPTCPLCKATF